MSTGSHPSPHSGPMFAKSKLMQRRETREKLCFKTRRARARSPGRSHTRDSCIVLAKGRRSMCERTAARRHSAVAGSGHFPSLVISRTLALMTYSPSFDSMGRSP
jgi:hypothetical protein